MKKLVILAALVVCAGSLYAQGQLQFNNRVVGEIVAQVYGPETGNSQTRKSGNTSAGTPVGTQTYTGALLAGSGFTAELWASTNGAPASSLQAVSAVNGGRSDFRTGAAAGWWNATVATIPGVIEGGTATVQVRVWDNRGGTITTWAAAQANLTIPQGSSDIFTVSGLGGILTTPPSIQNFRSFNITAVPEPSTIALGVLGVGALLLRRRK